MLTSHAQESSLNPQLVLPLPEWAPLPLHLWPEPPPISPQQLWMTLSPTTQSQARQTILRIFQEVMHDGPSS
jgi:hypothetical protein